MMLQQSTSLADRRKDTRIPNSGEITIRRVLSGPNLTGSLRDLSQNGCLIDLDAPVQLNLADVIELKLRSNPLSFRVMGFVRHLSENACLAGLEFHRIGDQSASDLATFISTMQDAATNAASHTDA